MEQILFEFAYFLLSQQLFSFFTAQAARRHLTDQQTDHIKAELSLLHV